MIFLKHKGQAIIEFALVTPLLFLIIFGFIYLAMFLVDYTTLNNIARNVARKAVINSSADTTYTITTKNGDDQFLLMDSYYNFGSEDSIECKLSTEDGMKIVTISAELKSGSSTLMKTVLPENYVIRYSMYSE